MSATTRDLDRLVRAELSRMGMENTNPATGRKVRGFRVPQTTPKSSAQIPTQCV